LTGAYPVWAAAAEFMDFTANNESAITKKAGFIVLPLDE
jgi:hypothetical protein